MFKYFKSFVLSAVAALLMSGAAQAQSQTLSYQNFLQQCIDFKKRSNVQEVWVVQFWASWNTASLQSLDQMKTLYNRYSQRPVRFVFVSTDKMQSDWERALQQYRLPGEQVLVPREADYDFLKRAFKHNEIPSFFVVDRQGMVQRIRDAAELELYMNEVTAGLPNRPYYSGAPAASTPPAATGSGNTGAGSLPPFPGSGSSQPAYTPPANTQPAYTPPASTQPAYTPPANTQPAYTPPANTQPVYTPPANTGAGGWLTHTVQPGETLFALYRRYNVPVDVIRQNNGLVDNNIRVGQVLRILRQ